MPPTPLDPTFDVQFARAQFPEANWLDGWALMENAGGAVVPNQVIRALTRYMTHNQVQPGAPYPAGRAAQEQMDRGHALMAEMIGADPGDVVIGPSTSINVYVLANALRHQWRPGDEIIVSLANHEANASPWKKLTEFKLIIKDWDINRETGSLDQEVLRGLLNGKTRLVALPHVSNITGEVNDVAAITRQVRDVGGPDRPLVCVDGVAYAPHRAVDVAGWDVDFYLFSFYKVFGPHMGLMYGKRAHLLNAKGQGHDFFPETDIQHKLNPAGPQHEMIAALAGISDYIEALAVHHDVQANSFTERARGVFALIQAHEERLSRVFLDGIADLPGLRLWGTRNPAARAPTFSFTINGMISRAVTEHLAGRKLGVSHGHFYAPRLLEATGVTDTEDGVCRASLAHYNTVEDVERLVQALEALI